VKILLFLAQIATKTGIRLIEMPVFVLQKNKNVMWKGREILGLSVSDKSE
jgi:hypothetical protein